MGNFDNWKWYSILENNVTNFNNPKIDKFGKEYVKLKVKNIMAPYAFVNINKKYIKTIILSDKRKYLRIGINTETTYFMNDQNGLIKKCLGTELLSFLEQMEKEDNAIKNT